MGRFGIVLILGIVLFSSMASSTTRHQNGEERLEWGEQVAIAMDLGPETASIGCSVIVRSGPRVDVCILTDTEYDSLVDVGNGMVTQFPQGSKIQTNSSSIIMDITKGTGYYLVVDNSEAGGAPEERERDSVWFTYQIAMFAEIEKVEDKGNEEMTLLETIGFVIFSVTVCGLIVAYLAWRFHSFVEGIEEACNPRPRYCQTPNLPRDGGQGAHHQGPPRPPPTPPQPMPRHHQPGHQQHGHQQPGYPSAGQGPPPQAYRIRPPRPPQPPPPPYRREVYHTDDTTYILEESPSMSMDTADYYSEQLAQQNRERRKHRRY